MMAMKRILKARFYKGDHIKDLRDGRIYTAEDIQYDDCGRRIIVAFMKSGRGIRFFDDDPNYRAVN